MSTKFVLKSETDVNLTLDPRIPITKQKSQNIMKHYYPFSVFFNLFLVFKLSIYFRLHRFAHEILKKSAKIKFSNKTQIFDAS